MPPNSKSSGTPPRENKKELRDKLIKDMEAYTRAGGQVEEIPTLTKFKDIKFQIRQKKAYAYRKGLQ